jgi:acetyltransferase-like isoleucine patch superfamily enzyme
VVLPQVKIGENAVVGAGAVVTRDVGDHTLVVGSPAHVEKTGIAGYKGIRVD